MNILIIDYWWCIKYKQRIYLYSNKRQHNYIQLTKRYSILVYKFGWVNFGLLSQIQHYPLKWTRVKVKMIIRIYIAEWRHEV